MTHLYSCRHDGDQYRITKFDTDLEVVSTYLCTTTECECPAGQRPMCRHREMLPWFINRPAVGTGEYFDFDRGGWVMVWQPPPKGVTVIGLDDPELVHNTIADAVGEPRSVKDEYLEGMSQRWPQVQTYPPARRKRSFRWRR